MATAVITSSIFQELQAFNHSRRTDLQQLASALQSGNFDAAKQAFNDLATIGKSRRYRNAEPFAISTARKHSRRSGRRCNRATLPERRRHLPR